MKTLQTIGVNLLVLGAFLLAILYFYPQIPELNFGSYVYKVAPPPLWALAVTLGGGLMLLILGLVGAATEKANKSPDQKDE